MGTSCRTFFHHVHVPGCVLVGVIILHLALVIRVEALCVRLSAELLNGALHVLLVEHFMEVDAHTAV